MAAASSENVKKEATRLFDRLEEHEAVEHFFDGQVLGLLYDCGEDHHHARLGYYEDTPDGGQFSAEMMIDYTGRSLLVTQHNEQQELHPDADYKIVEIDESYLDRLEGF